MSSASDGSLCHSKKAYASFNQIPPPREDELPDLLGTQNDDSVTTENSNRIEINGNELRDLLDIPTAITSAEGIETETPEVNHAIHSNHEEPAVGVNTGNSENLSPTTTNDRKGDVNTTMREGNTTSINDELMQDGISNTTSIPQRNTERRDQKNASINDETTQDDVSNSTNIQTNKTTETEHDDSNDLQAAVLGTTQERPIEKFYNEWITTFSDDSLFDEMTETLDINSTRDNQQSPEQRAAEGLMMLSTHRANEDSDVLLPVDTPRLPDLVKEMECANVDTESELKEKPTKEKTDDHHEASKSPTNSTGHTENVTKGSKPSEKNKKDKLPKSPYKGVFKMRTIGLRKHQSPVHRTSKKIGCSMCNQKFDDRQGLKIHHQQDHNILPCNICEKSFSTKKSLAKHMYKHSELPWKCKECGEGYAFPSELKAHLIKHETEPMPKCNIIGCKKEYKRQSELTAHMKTHDGNKHKCPEDRCVYEAVDIRYLKNHMRIHSDALPYPCKYCDKAFKHFMQRKRHYSNDHPK